MKIKRHILTIEAIIMMVVSICACGTTENAGLNGSKTDDTGHYDIEAGIELETETETEIEVKLEVESEKEERNTEENIPSVSVNQIVGPWHLDALSMDMDALNDAFQGAMEFGNGLEIRSDGRIPGMLV